MSINSYYVLMWEAAANPPVHPTPMIGKRSFVSIFDAIKFFNNLSKTSKFISLTLVQKTETDFSEVFEKLVNQEIKPEIEMCSYCMGSGLGGHPDSGYVCWVCNGSGGVETLEHKWAGGNDTCYCLNCGLEYAYGKEPKPGTPCLI